MSTMINCERRLLLGTKCNQPGCVEYTAEIRRPRQLQGRKLTQVIYIPQMNRILRQGIKSQSDPKLMFDVPDVKLIAPKLITPEDFTDDSKIILYQQRSDKRNQILFQAELGFD